MTATNASNNKILSLKFINNNKNDSNNKNISGLLTGSTYAISTVLLFAVSQYFT